MFRHLLQLRAAVIPIHVARPRFARYASGQILIDAVLKEKEPENIVHAVKHAIHNYKLSPRDCDASLHLLAKQHPQMCPYVYNALVESGITVEESLDRALLESYCATGNMSELGVHIQKMKERYNGLSAKSLSTALDALLAKKHYIAAGSAFLELARVAGPHNVPDTHVVGLLKGLVGMTIQSQTTQPQDRSAPLLDAQGVVELVEALLRAGVIVSGSAVHLAARLFAINGSPAMASKLLQAYNWRANGFKRDATHWNYVLEGYARLGDVEGLLDAHNLLLQDGLMANESSITYLVDALRSSRTAFGRSWPYRERTLELIQDYDRRGRIDYCMRLLRVEFNHNAVTFVNDLVNQGRSREARVIVEVLL